MGTKVMPMNSDLNRNRLGRLIKKTWRHLFLITGVLVYTSAFSGFDQDFEKLYPSDKRSYFDSDYEAKCLLDRIKPGMDATAVITIKQVCRRMSIPKRCRDRSDISGPDCFAKCQQANFYQRNLGDCSMG